MKRIDNNQWTKEILDTQTNWKNYSAEKPSKSHLKRKINVGHDDSEPKLVYTLWSYVFHFEFVYRHL